jgi:hypothetical protein
MRSAWPKLDHVFSVGDEATDGEGVASLETGRGGPSRTVPTAKQPVKRVLGRPS